MHTSEFNKPIVSVIVPVYNLGESVIPCLRSVFNQVYENIELIVVDDGSTDNSFEICGELTKDNNNALILRKENGGLGSARDFGIDHAHGDYLFFLDGDDVLVKEAIELLVSLSERFSIDIVSTELQKIRKPEQFQGHLTDRGVFLDSAAALGKMFLLRGESGSSCGKLIARRLFENMRFPEGQLFEDFGVVAKLLGSSRGVFFSEARVYGYMTREGSITAVKSYGPNHLAGMEASLKVALAAAEQYPELRRSSMCFAAYCKLRVASKLASELVGVRTYRCYIEESKKVARSAALIGGQTIVWRMRLMLFGISMNLHNLFYSLYGRVTGKVVG